MRKCWISFCAMVFLVLAGAVAARGQEKVLKMSTTTSTENSGLWLVSPKAQALIANYKIQGQQAFFPDAAPGAK